MRKLTNDEIVKVIAERLSLIYDCEPEMLQTTIANVIATYHAMKNEDVETKEENERKSRLKTELFVRVAELNDELEAKLSKLGYRKDLFKFEVNEEYRPWEEVKLIDYNKKTVLLKNISNLDDFESWSENFMARLATFAYLVSEFYDRLDQEGTETTGLRIKHRDTYHRLEILPTFEDGYVHVYERLPLEIERGRYAEVKTSEDSWVLVHGDNLVASFEYRKSDVPVNEIDDVMDEIDRLYNSVKGE